MVWRHGKNTQFRVLSQGAKWTKWRWSVIFCCFLTLSICFFFLRGQLSNLDKLDKIAKVNTGRGLVMFLSLAFSFPQSRFQTLFCLVNPLPEFSVMVTVRQNDSVKAIGGQGCVMLFDCATIHRAKPNSALLPWKILTGLLKRHCSIDF